MTEWRDDRKDHDPWWFPKMAGVILGCIMVLEWFLAR